MKKNLLLFSALFIVSIVNAQSDASVMLTIDPASTVISSSGSDNSFIATLPSGEPVPSLRPDAAGGCRRNHQRGRGRGNEKYSPEADSGSTNVR